jgi:hypothetical protein
MGEPAERQDAHYRELLRDLPRRFQYETRFLARHLSHMSLEELDRIDHWINKMQAMHDKETCREDHERAGLPFKPWRTRW